MTLLHFSCITFSMSHRSIDLTLELGGLTSSLSTFQTGTAESVWKGAKHMKRVTDYLTLRSALTLLHLDVI